MTKIPRFAFEKFPEADATLTTQMKSVGETMAIGRTFKESFQKALRGLEVGSFGFGCDGKDKWGTPEQPGEGRNPGQARRAQRRPRASICGTRSRAGMTVEQIHELTQIDPWFLDQLCDIVRDGRRAAGDRRFASRRFADVPQGEAVRLLRSAACHAVADRAKWTFATKRKSRGIVPTYKSVDTCAAEFEAYTPYYYSTYEDEDETPPKQPGKKRIMILGGGPNRIGQGIEFDYCCCHASFALRELGIESVMVNSNPGDGQHRLRHVGPAVLRAADDRGRAQHLRPHSAGRRDRAVRRPDAAESGPGPGQRRRADHRHQRRYDRSGRGSREVRRHSRRGWTSSSRRTASPAR